MERLNKERKKFNIIDDAEEMLSLVFDKAHMLIDDKREKRNQFDTQQREYSYYDGYIDGVSAILTSIIMLEKGRTI